MDVNNLGSEISKKLKSALQMFHEGGNLLNTSARPQGYAWMALWETVNINITVFVYVKTSQGTFKKGDIMRLLLSLNTGLFVCHTENSGPVLTDFPVWDLEEFRSRDCFENAILEERLITWILFNARKYQPVLVQQQGWEPSLVFPPPKYCRLCSLERTTKLKTPVPRMEPQVFAVVDKF